MWLLGLRYSSLFCKSESCDDLPFLVDCGSLPTENATVYYTLGTTYGSIATVTCDSGYTLEGPDHVLCQLGATWSDIPECQKGGLLLSS